MKGEIPMKKLKKTKRFLTIAAIILSVLVLFPTTASAAGKTKLNTTKKTINVGDSCTVKLLNNKKKVKWSVSNKNIKIVSKNNKQAKIKGVKKGTSYLKAKVGSKTYKCKVTVKEKKTKGNGTRENPYSAYDWHTVDVCTLWGESTGKVKIKLIEYMDGKKAKNYLDKKLDYYGKIDLKKYEEIIYMRFNVKCTESEKGIFGGNIVGNIYNFKRNKRINVGVILSDTLDGFDNMNTIHLQKGGTSTCAFMVVARKDKSPYSYTCFDGEGNEIWFTTKK